MSVPDGLRVQQMLRDTLWNADAVEVDELHLLCLCASAQNMQSVRPAKRDALMVKNIIATHAPAIRRFAGLGDEELNRLRHWSPRGRRDEHLEARLDSILRGAALLAVINEDDLVQVAARFGIERGLMEKLWMSAAGFAKQCIRFCETNSWRKIASLLNNLSRRLDLRAREDLFPLLALPSVTVAVARILVGQGVSSPSDIAKMAEAQLGRILLSAGILDGRPFTRRILREASDWVKARDRLLGCNGRALLDTPSGLLARCDAET
jgi:hypothetical protein